jgi:streptogramin lyase
MRNAPSQRPAPARCCATIRQLSAERVGWLIGLVAIVSASLWAPASTSALSIVQHPLAGSYSPATAIAGWAGGLAITREEREARVVLQRLSATPSFSVGAAQDVEVLTMTQGPDGDLWIVNGTPVAGSAAPALSLDDMLPSGSLQLRHQFAAPLGSSEWPSAIATGPDGSLWIANMTGDTIERVYPDGQATVYPLPRAGSPTSIALASDGSAWFTELATGTIGEVTPEGSIVEHAIAPGAGYGGFGTSEPYSIVLGPDGALWFTEQGTGRIGRMTTTGALAEYPIPAAAGLAPGSFGWPAPRDITVGPDGALWFTDPGDESIGRASTAGAISEYPIGGSATPTPDAITSYGGELWFTEAGLQDVASANPDGSPTPAAGSGPLGDGAVRSIRSGCPTQRRHRGRTSRRCRSRSAARSERRRNGLRAVRRSV